MKYVYNSPINGHNWKVRLEYAYVGCIIQHVLMFWGIAVVSGPTVILTSWYKSFSDQYVLYQIAPCLCHCLKLKSQYLFRNIWNLNVHKSRCKLGKYTLRSCCCYNVNYYFWKIFPRWQHLTKKSWVCSAYVEPTVMRTFQRAVTVTWLSATTPSQSLRPFSQFYDHNIKIFRNFFRIGQSFCTLKCITIPPDYQVPEFLPANRNYSLTFPLLI